MPFGERTVQAKNLQRTSLLFAKSIERFIMRKASPNPAKRFLLQLKNAISVDSLAAVEIMPKCSKPMQIAAQAARRPALLQCADKVDCESGDSSENKDLDFAAAWARRQQAD